MSECVSECLVSVECANKLQMLVYVYIKICHVGEAHIKVAYSTDKASLETSNKLPT